MAKGSAVMNRPAGARPASPAGDAAIHNATVILGDAVRKFGSNDPRVGDAETQLESVKKSFELKEADLKAGRPVARTDFEAVNANATALTTRLASMGRLENELDLTTIGGAILLLLLLGGGVLFLRKMRERQQGL